MAGSLLKSAVVFATAVASTASAASQKPVLTTTCNGQSYTYHDLAGYGMVPSAARDKYGDSMSIGSSIAFASWEKEKGKDGAKYKGKMYGLPDRGWNTHGTINFQPRIHEFTVSLTLSPNATAGNPAAPNVAFVYQDSILLTGPDGEPTTGLDADQSGGLEYPGFPTLPAATYPGNGFGGPGPGGKRVTIDAEGLVLSDDGGFWISDEYGPYAYKFDKQGKMTDAIAPPDAILPVRNNKVSFASNNPPLYDPSHAPVPADPAHGRQNNQGFEGMTMSPDGKYLYVLLQSAARQEGGQKSSNRRHLRMLQYYVKNCGGRYATMYKAEYVVPLPVFEDETGKKLVAAQSEMHFVSDTQFFFLPRDSNRGHGMKNTTSLYRHVDIFDISEATNVKGPEHDSFNGSIASVDGVLNDDITPATVCPFIDFNINEQLNKFGLHNGGPQDGALLNEKWEGIALLPVSAEDKAGSSADEEYFLFAASDNDFSTLNGFTNFGRLPYSEDSGYDLDNQMLVFRITLPKGSRPLVG